MIYFDEKTHNFLRIFINNSVYYDLKLSFQVYLLYVFAYLRVSLLLN